MAKYADMIFRIVTESHGHMTAEQIFWELKKENPRVVLATVYNNLNALCGEEKIRKVTIEGSPDRYDITQRHDHMVCKRCGKLSDVRFADFTKELERQLGETILSYDLKVFYLCPECKASKVVEKEENKENTRRPDYRLAE